MSEIIRVDLGDGFQARVQSTDYYASGTTRGGGSASDPELSKEVTKLHDAVHATAHVAKSIRADLAPDRLELKVSLGLSGEVGWFFAKSAVDGVFELTLEWERNVIGNSTPRQSEQQ